MVYAGRLSPEKGVDILVARRAACCPGSGCVVAGRRARRGRARGAGRPRSRPAGCASSAGVRGAEVPASCSPAAGAVAVPSRCYENQPLAVLEAFAAGIPVVGSALGGIAELVADGVTGHLVPADDPAALARGIARLLADPVAAARMGAAGRALVLDGYSPQGHLDRLLELYAEAAELAGAAAPTGAGRAR